MVYAKRFQVRQSSVLVIVLLLMGSVLYEVTRTESLARQSAAARTQDISLPAVQPVVVKPRLMARTDYIGSASGAGVQVRAAWGDQDVLPWAPQAAAVSARTAALAAASTRGSGASFSGAVAPRAHSSSGSGYAPGGYGMSGVGAWGGVSGVMRPEPAAAATKVATAKPARPTRSGSTSTKRPGSNSSGRPGSNSSGGAADGESGLLLASGFTAGAASVEPGAVAALQTTGGGGNASPASAPAPTPEPMSLMLMGTGLVALYNTRRFFH